jgi:hypothetical protein
MGAALEFGPDLTGDFGLGLAGIQNMDAIGFGSGGGEVPLANRFIESERFLLHPVSFRLWLGSTPETLEASLRIDIKEEGHIREAGPGGKEQQLRLRRQGVPFRRMLKEVADVFPNGSAAGLPNQDRFLAHATQILDELPNLRALAATFRTLETDEETCLTHVGPRRVLKS